MRFIVAAVALTALGALPVAAQARLAVSVTPEFSAVDAPVTIRVSGAAAFAHVSIEAQTTIFGTQFTSQATFVADADGSVDANSAPAVDGSYRGIDGMGLFWSMRPAAGAAPHDGKFDYLAPRTIAIRATAGNAHAERSVVRLVLADGIAYRDVREDGIYARFYAHARGCPLPTLVVLGGSEGGLPEDRPAVLASHGFNALALAYFGVDGLPQQLTDIPLETVGKALAWLSHQPCVDATRIGIVGGSKGAELALLAASRFPAIGAVVALAPSSVVFPGIYYGKRSGPEPSSWSYGGAPLPFVDGTPPPEVAEKISLDVKNGGPVSYAPDYLWEVRGATNREAATIPVERIRGPVMLVSGDDDRLWPSSFMAGAIVDRLTAARHPFPDVWLHYPNAGHEIGEPYYVYTDSTRAHLPRYTLDLGGSPQANETASADAWPAIVAFLRKHLLESRP